MLYYTRRRAGAVYLYDVSTDITNRFNLQICFWFAHYHAEAMKTSPTALAM